MINNTTIDNKKIDSLINLIKKIRIIPNNKEEVIELMELIIDSGYIDKDRKKDFHLFYNRGVVDIRINNSLYNLTRIMGRDITGINMTFNKIRYYSNIINKWVEYPIEENEFKRLRDKYFGYN